MDSNKSLTALFNALSGSSSDPTGGVITPRDPWYYRFYITSYNYSGTVTFSTGGLPSCVSASFNPSSISINPGETSQQITLKLTLTSGWESYVGQCIPFMLYANGSNCFWAKEINPGPTVQN
jgi:hypothetical protein